MERLRMLLVIAALLVPIPAVAVAGPPAQSAGPTVPFQGDFPMTVAAGEYELLYLVLDFAPGAGIPLHYHGGPATVVGMTGELTLRPEGKPEKKLQPGGVVQKMALMKHEMLNLSASDTRVLAVILLPKGAEVTTVVATGENTMPGPTVPFQGSYPITVEAGEYNLVNIVLDFAPGAGIPLHYHGGPAVVVGMQGELTLRPEGKPEKKLRPGDVVQEVALARHEMINVSSADTRVLAGVLLPKGAELTTIVQHHTGMPMTGEVASRDMLIMVLAVALLCIAVGGAALVLRRLAR